jgi:Carboxypeptidase regulatory-like domain
MYLFFIALAFLIPASAQTEATITGTIRDPSGSGLPSASVTINNVETGATRRVVADSEGRYAAPALAVGKYELSAARTGFASEIKTGITLAVGQQINVDFTLQIGELKQAVKVEETITPVNLTTQQTSGLVGEQQVKDLPLNGRSYDELLSLNPSTVNYSNGRSGGVGTSNSAVGNMFAVAGRRPQENLFLLNGIEYTGASVINVTPGGTSGQLLGVDAVREFNVVTDAYGAEYGKRPGAQISIVTAAGTNAIHGSLYEFFRNSALDARYFFDQGSIPQFQRNNFGAALGAPIQKDKTFVFGNYEGYRQHLGLSDVTLVPDNNARLGIVGTTNVGITPAAQALLSLWPVQNGPSLGSGIGIAYSHPLQIVREDFGTARFDHIFSDRDAIFGVYTIDDSADQTPSANPLSGVVESLREQVASIQETHIFSASALNTARVGFSRGSYYFTGTTPVNLPGWVAGAPIGAVVIGGGTALNAASQITAAGTNAGSNQLAARNLFTFEDHVSLTHGIHRIDFGFWAQRIQANDDLAQDQYGQASFSSLTSFLQGTIGTFTVVPQSTPLGWRSTELAGFVQDAMKLRPNLEVTVGLRIESTNGMNESHGRASNYLFDSNGVIETQPTVGANVFTKNNAKFLPEPRIGIAWDPFGHHKTVIHAGFGLYHALLDNLSYRLDQNGPFNTTVAIKNLPLAGLNIAPGVALPAGSLVSPSGIQPDAKTPTVESYTLRIEQQLTKNLSLAVGYVGSRGYHEIISIDANLPVPTFVNGNIFYPSGSPLANPKVANTTTWWSSGDSNYNALQVDVSHRLAHRLQIRGVYTYAKSLDDGTAWNSSVGTNAPGFVMFPPNPKIDWGLSTYDVRNSAVIHGTYEIWKGWSISAIETLQSGFPFTPQLGYNPSGDGDSRNPVRPNWNPNFTGPIILGSPTQYFNPAAFSTPATGTYGNVGRDTLIGPGIAELDLSALKRFTLTEKVTLQFRAELFNVLNRANFGTPNAVVFSSATSGISPTAGVITATSTTSRQIQFGLKLIW